MFTCHTCGEEFQNRSLLDKHKIQKHGYTPEKLGWLVAGWNKGIPHSSKGNPHPKSSWSLIDLNKRPEFIAKRQKSALQHDKKVVEKAKILKEKGFRVFITSNYAHHKRIPDIITITPEGKVVAYELESIKKYKASIDTLRKKYTEYLMSEGFFDDVIVEGFLENE